VTHDQLVERAARWLRRTRRCPVVATEIVTTNHTGECLDAIGWHQGYSILVECKASRSDFLADRRKTFRTMERLGMGDQRYYMTPPALVRPDELPPKWGLLEVHGRQVRVIRRCEDPDRPYNSAPFEASHREEKIVLLSILRRTRGEYTLPTKRTTVAVQPDALEASADTRQPERERECFCHRCVEERERDIPWTERPSRMIVCEHCGNKRCPHATDHRHACTGSNEPDQPGGIFGGVPGASADTGERA
jgi:hypothetical protein